MELFFRNFTCFIFPSNTNCWRFNFLSIWSESQHDLLIFWCVFNWRVSDLETFCSKNFELHFCSLDIYHQNYFHDTILNFLFNLTIIKRSLFNEGFFPVWFQINLSWKIKKINDIWGKSFKSFFEAWMSW